MRKNTNSSMSKSPDRKDGGSPLKVTGEGGASSTMKRVKTKSKKKPGKGGEREQIENEDNPSEDPQSDDKDGNGSPSGKRRFKASGRKKIKEAPQVVGFQHDITKDFSNFDMLWYDLSIKVRTLF